MPTDRFELAGDYVPDPEREITALLDGFFGFFAAHGISAELIGAMRARHEELQQTNAHLIVDEPARHNLRITLAVTAAYRTLRSHLGRPAAIEAVRRALAEPLGAAIREGTKAMLDAASDPFAAMVALCKTREEHAFGKGFTFHRAADDDRHYLLEVRRCFYHEVLVANSAPELTPVLCAFDANWIEAIDPARDGFRFERTTTIGLGGTHCPFHFIRTGDTDS